MDCGHNCNNPCHVGNHPKCKVMVDFRFKMCGHQGNRKCFEEEDTILCKLDDEIKRLKSMELEPSVTDLQEDGSTAAEYMQVVDKTERFIQPGHNMALVVTRIQKVFNRELEIRFLNARRNLFEPNIDPQPLFHGTDDAAIEGITKEGFRLPRANKNNMFGRGCYFATDSSKSAQNIYTKGSNKLFLCSVLLGKTWTVQEDHPDMDPEKLRKKGFDSVYSKRGGVGTGGTSYDEFIVYNPAQALPEYVVHFKMQDLEPLNKICRYLPCLQCLMRAG
eukprot:TRINITY_DN642_c0_g2_i4.p1 TRINITY_DN642_c0_g2~~TRINITY_DN642_c0_g2_i4.p1  ORF type:complete len:315 (+),score=37.72 TRINITY_DN642_c0_g2_i4:119-946(+)